MGYEGAGCPSWKLTGAFMRGAPARWVTAAGAPGSPELLDGPLSGLLGEQEEAGSDGGGSSLPDSSL